MMSGNYNSIDSKKVSGPVPAVPDHAPDVTIKFSETNLQTFPPSRVQGKISSGTRPPQDADEAFSSSRFGSDEPQQQGGWLQMFLVSSYQPYFDVDTSDVLERIKDSMFPLRGTFTEKIAGNLDLYGVRTLLDLHHPDIRRSFDRQFCNVRSSQSEETRMELRHQCRGVVGGTFLRLRFHHSRRAVFRPQVLFRAIGARSTTLPLRIFPVYLRSCTVPLHRATGDI